MNGCPLVHGKGIFIHSNFLEEYMKVFIFAVCLALSGQVAAQEKKVFSNEGGAWQSDATNWKPFLIERVTETVSRVTGGKNSKTSQFVAIKSESQWYEVLRTMPYMANAKLLGHFGSSKTPVFCTDSCKGVDPNRSYVGLYESCVQDCDAADKLPIEHFFADNEMNFRPTAKRVGPRIDAATGLPVGADGMYYDPVTGAKRTPAEEAARQKDKGKKVISM
jgi:hypothetical protein